MHTDSTADASARAVDAVAYTVGRDVVFQGGYYAPASPSGRRLLAHELAHVVQQGAAPDAGVPARLEIGATDDLSEREAEATAARVTAPTTTAEPAGSASRAVPKDGLPRTGAPSPTATTRVGDGPPGSAPDQPEGAMTHERPAASAGAAVLARQAATAPTRRICGPDITDPLMSMLGRVEPWFRRLTGFQQARACAGLGPSGPAWFVNPIMAWDTRELFLPNTGWLDPYFSTFSCGSPRDPGCPTDPTRHLCETSGGCGNSVVVGGKCMLAGTANYALFGRMCRVCHDLAGRWGRWDMRATINMYKTLSRDDPGPPREMATAAYDGTLPTVPTAAENRAGCSGRCGQAYGGSFDFIWEPYRPR